MFGREIKTCLNYHDHHFIFFPYSSAGEMKIVRLESAAGFIDTGGGGTGPDVLLGEKRMRDALGRL